MENFFFISFLLTGASVLVSIGSTIYKFHGVKKRRKQRFDSMFGEGAFESFCNVTKTKYIPLVMTTRDIKAISDLLDEPNAEQDDNQISQVFRYKVRCSSTHRRIRIDKTMAKKICKKSSGSAISVKNSKYKRPVTVFSPCYSSQRQLEAMLSASSSSKPAITSKCVV
jgi:hypothetical protein